ncbi:MAG TPA: terminase [Blastocatellia bacterium]|nr:terminase [Blastocatellia bacterium]
MANNEFSVANHDFPLRKDRKGKRRKVPFDRDQRCAFLALLRRGCTVSYAIQTLGLARRAPYTHREKSRKFAQQWAEAIEAGTDFLEDEARRRAVDGVTKPVFYQGLECGSVQEYSDGLLQFLLKGRRPEKFRDNINLDVSCAIQVEYCNDWRRTQRVIEAEAEAVDVQAAPAAKALVGGEPQSGTNRTE